LTKIGGQQPIFRPDMAKGWSPLELLDEKNRGCRSPHAFHSGDPVNGLVEIRGCRAGDRHKQIKLAADGIAAHDFRSLLETGDNAALLLHLQLDQDDRGKRSFVKGPLAEQDRVAGDDAVAFEPVQPWLQSGPRDTELLGDFGQRHSGIRG
jgi:hypothetical protein